VSEDREFETALADLPDKELLWELYVEVKQANRHLSGIRVSIFVLSALVAVGVIAGILNWFV
jgi:hypothetical protein